MFGKNSRSKRKNKSEKRVSNKLENSQKVFSYYTASRKQLDNFERTSNMIQDDNIRLSRLSRVKQLWFMALVGLALIAVTGYLITLGNSPRIGIEGSLYRDRTTYQKIVSETFDEDFRNRFKPLLQTESLQSKIASNIPEAQSVYVRSTFLGHRPEVNIIMAKPMAVFAQNTTNYIISNRGRVLLLRSKSNIDTTSLPIINNQSGVTVAAGSQFLRPDEADSLGKLIYQYDEKGVKGVIYTINTIPHEVQAKEPGRGYYTKYLLDGTIDQQFGAMVSTQKKLQEIGQLPGEYIDARLAEKIYFK
jgi:hypothetical protein